LSRNTATVEVITSGDVSASIPPAAATAQKTRRHRSAWRFAFDGLCPPSVNASGSAAGDTAPGQGDPATASAADEAPKALVRRVCLMPWISPSWRPTNEVAARFNATHRRRQHPCFLQAIYRFFAQGAAPLGSRRVLTRISFTCASTNSSGNRP